MIQKRLLAVDSGILTVGEVAAFFRCDPETVKRGARSGKLPGFKFGKFWLFRRHDIDKMIDRSVDAAQREQQ
jgi:excisionase family DNA binding protein